MLRPSPLKIIILFFVVTMLAFRLFCGIFVIQPLGFLPKGATVIYWRRGMKLPFISSVDALLDETGAGVSLLGRAMAFSILSKPIIERKIIKVGYSDTLYLWSTKGKRYQK